MAYTFPLPVGGILLSFNVRIGERTYQGEVVPRAKAEVDYENAITAGNSAFRLQEIRAGLYNATLGNVMPGESVAISIVYAETLAWNGNSLRYRLPTTIAPRYGEPIGMQPWQVPVTSLMAEYSLALSVTIAGDLSRSAISCPSHRVSFVHESDELKITLANGASMGRDFILELSNDGVQSLGVSASARDTHLAMLTLLPPPVEQHSQSRCGPDPRLLRLDAGRQLAARQGNSAGTRQHATDGAIRPGGLRQQRRYLRQSASAGQSQNIELARRWVTSLEDMGGAICILHSRKR